jgi:polyisoprenoid-binding protein YceI
MTHQDKSNIEEEKMTTQSEKESPTQSIWQLDPNHTLVEFSAKHMMVTTVKGHFQSVRGTIIFDEADPSHSSVEIEIDAASLVTGVEYRDNHLKSADFLEVEKYPLITFKSTRIEPTGSDRAKIVGDLTIHSVTREVVLDAELAGRGKSPMGHEVAAFDARTSINRKDFGLVWNMALETGGVLVSETIKIEISVEGIKQAA